MEERQTNYTIAEGYELPSGGKVYDKPVNAHVELRSMTARDEMRRLSPSSTPFKKLSDIIEGCMVEKPAIHVYDMCLGDYEFLLHKLRVVTYGTKYAISTTCPYCGELVETEINLDDLKLKEFDLAELEATKTFTLPKSQHIITLNFQTPRMIDEIDARAREMKRKFSSSDIDFETFVKLMLSIGSVDGNIISSVDLEQFINNLPALDMQKILNNIDKLNGMIGLDTSFFVNCTKCGNEFKSFFRFGTEFFRPTNI